MDLDELKNAWTALDDRLKKNEILNAQIIREMKQTKMNKSLSKLVDYEILSLIILLILLPLTFIVSCTENVRDSFILKILFIYLIIFLPPSIVWYTYKLYGLLKIKFSNKIANNIYLINRYNIQIKKEKLWGMIAAVPFPILIIVFYIQIKVPMNLLIFMTCVFIVIGIFTYWMYIKIYDSNIQSIQKSLDELKELEEEKEEVA